MARVHQTALGPEFLGHLGPSVRQLSQDKLTHYHIWEYNGWNQYRMNARELPRSTANRLKKPADIVLECLPAHIGCHARRAELV